MSELFDIVVHVSHSSAEFAKSTIDRTVGNIVGYRNVYLVCQSALVAELRQHNAAYTVVDDSAFPFSLDTVAELHGKKEMNGWYFRQLIHLYAGSAIPGILGTYLVIAADAAFLRPTEFKRDGKCLYNFGDEYHFPYFVHMHKMNPYLSKDNLQQSGVCGHIMIETRFVDMIFGLVESNNAGAPFYRVFLEKVEDANGTGASEYEIYFNYVLKYHRDQIEVRALNWAKIVDIESMDGMAVDYVVRE